MIVLDENIDDSEWHTLRSWRIRARKIGKDAGRRGKAISSSHRRNSGSWRRATGKPARAPPHDREPVEWSGHRRHRRGRCHRGRHDRLGVSGHELPSVTHENATPVDEGFVFSVEPGVYLPGEFGVRLEEIVYVDRSGAHRLSALPREVHIAGR